MLVLNAIVAITSLEEVRGVPVSAKVILSINAGNTAPCSAEVKDEDDIPNPAFGVIVIVPVDGRVVAFIMLNVVKVKSLLLF